MQDRTEVVSQATSSAGSLLTVGSGLWVWLGQNHDQIAVLCAIIGMLVAVIGAVVNWLHKRKVIRILESNKIITPSELQSVLNKKS